LDGSSWGGAIAVHPTIVGMTVEEQYPAVPSFLISQSVVRRDLLHADISVADEFLRMIAAPVHLQGNPAGIGVALLGFCPLHEFHAVDPRGDGGRIPGDTRTEFVPFPVVPEARPALWLHGQRKRRWLSPDVGHFVEETEVHNTGFGAELSFPVQAHQI